MHALLKHTQQKIDFTVLRLYEALPLSTRSALLHGNFRKISWNNLSQLKISLPKTNQFTMIISFHKFKKNMRQKHRARLAWRGTQADMQKGLRVFINIPRRREESSEPHVLHLLFAGKEVKGLSQFTFSRARLGLVHRGAKLPRVRELSSQERERASFVCME